MSEEEERIITIYLTYHTSHCHHYIMYWKKKYLISYLFVTLPTSFSIQFVIDYFLWLVSLGSRSSYLLT